MIPILATGCTSTYDAYGRPQQSVDPGVAVAGAVAAGLIGLALASDRDDDYGHHGYGGGSYGGYSQSQYSSYQGGYGGGYECDY